MSYNMDDRKRPALANGSLSKKKSKPASQEFKVKPLECGARDQRYQDEVHQTIDICPVMQALMGTEQFQRLRRVKQLGTSDLVFACSNHTRFEHSVGVAFLAEEMCKRIQEKQKDLKTTDKDVLCVKLAGLLHDIGHGPFSHVYEVFRGEIKKLLKEDPVMEEKYKKFPPVPEDWAHERSSLHMIDAALESFGLAIDMEHLDKPLKQIGHGVDPRTFCVYNSSVRSESDENILTSRDWIFIKECIYGEPIPGVKEKLGIDERIGRKEDEKEWLYDIVSNRYSGIDVDKVDYFARDQRRSLAEIGRVNVTILFEARVAKAGCKNPRCKRCEPGGRQHYMICYPKKCVREVCRFFRIRKDMHGMVYQHKTTTASGCMVIDILKKADLHYLIKGKDQLLPISRAVLDQEAFLQLKDTIIDSIAESTSEELRPARELAKRFLARKLYSKY
jgi:HD superfamily phosphohydrolase